MHAVPQRKIMHISETARLPETGNVYVAKLGKLIGTVSEACAALLVLAEIGVLIAGTAARYFFNNPLTWTDELASLLFLWLAMFGSVIALRQGAHMRLTTFINKMPPAMRSWMEVFAMALRRPSCCSSSVRPMNTLMKA